jgi:5-methyltetrahydrofolate--homocysteine methyltransferase
MSRLLFQVYLPLKSAREKALKLDWSNFTPTRPTFLGEKVFRNFPLTDLLPFVDWKCFFDVWELRGRYPNGRYPKIFNDEIVGKRSLLLKRK